MVRTAVLPRVFALLLLVLAGSCSSQSNPSFVVRSPDGRTEVHLTLENRGGTHGYPNAIAPYYEVRRDGRVVIEASPLGLDTDRTRFRDGLSFVSSTERTIDESYATVIGKRRARTVRGNERTTRFRAPSGDEIEIVFRAHDDGVAFRYRVLGEGTVTVTQEHTGFALPSAARAYMASFDVAGALAGSYELPYEQMTVGTPNDTSTGFVYPVLVEVEAGLNVLLTEADATSAYCVTRLDSAPDGNLYRIRFPEATEGQGVGPVEPTSTLPLETPFRVLAIGSFETIVESTLVDDLARPTAQTDVSWIEPGRAAWSWATQGTGDVTLATSYATFASGLGWEYVLVDDGWDKWTNVDTTMPAFVAQAKTQGVKVLLWYSSGGPTAPNIGSPRDRMSDPTVREAEMAKLESWGVAGIKVDFFQSDKQERIAAYLGILEDAARHHLVVNFHGATLPRGWIRTYPNLLTTEAVRGAEYYFTPVLDVPSPRFLVLDVFLRNVVGPMDFTPSLFAKARASGGVGYGASLAEPVAFESGITHFSDRADGSTTEGYGALFAAFPFVRDYLAAVPVVWDETQLLDGSPETHVVLARRHGASWWIAGLDGDAGSRRFDVPLEVLGGPYHCRVTTGGADGATLTETITDVDATSTLGVDTVEGDGFLAWCEPR